MNKKIVFLLAFILFPSVSHTQSNLMPDEMVKTSIANSEVKIQYNNKEFSGKASLVTDEKLNQKLSQLKYPGEERANEKRVAIEVTLDKM